MYAAKLKNLEERYQKRLTALNANYDERIKNLATTLRRTVRQIQADQVLAALKEDEASFNFVNARISEILEGTVKLERETALKNALSRASKKTVELDALRSEFLTIQDKLRQKEILEAQRKTASDSNVASLDNECQFLSNSVREKQSQLDRLAKSERAAKERLSQCERDRDELKQKYLSLGEKMELILESEDSQRQQMLASETEKRSVLQTALTEEQRARKRDKAAHKKMKAELEKTISILQKEVQADGVLRREPPVPNEERLRLSNEIEKCKDELKSRQREFDHKMMLKEDEMRRLRGDYELTAKQAQSGTTQLQLEWENKLQQTMQKMEQEKRHIHMQYQRLIDTRLAEVKQADQVQRSALQASLAAAQQQLAAAESRNKELEAEVPAAASAAAAAAQDQLSLALQHAADRQELEARAAVLDYENRATQLEQALNTAHHKLQEAEAGRQQQQQRVQQLEESLASAREEVQAVQAGRAAVLSSLEEAKAELERANRQLSHTSTSGEEASSLLQQIDAARKEILRARKEKHLAEDRAQAADHALLSLEKDRKRIVKLASQAEAADRSAAASAAECSELSTQLTQLRQEHKDVTTRLHQLQLDSESSTLQQQQQERLHSSRAEQLQTENFDLVKQVEDYKVRLRSAEKELYQSNRQLEAAGKELLELQTATAAAAQQQQQLLQQEEEDRQAVEQYISELQQQLSIAVSSSHASTNQLEKQAQQHLQQQEALSHASQVLEQKAKQDVSQNTVIESQRKRIAALQEQLASYEASNSTLMDTLTRLRSEHSSLKADVHKSLDEMSKANAERTARITEQQQQQQQQQQEQLDTLKAQSASHSRQREGWVREKDGWAREKGEWDRERASLHQQLDKARAARQEELEAITLQLGDSRADLGKARAKGQHLAQQLADAERRCADLEEQTSQLTADTAALRQVAAQHTACAPQLTAVQNQSAVLAEELENQKSNYLHLLIVLSTEVQLPNHLQKSLLSLDAAVFQQALKEFQQFFKLWIVDTKSSVSHNASVMIAPLRKQLTDQQVEVRHLEAELDQSRQTVTRLQQQLTAAKREAEQEHDRSNKSKARLEKRVATQNMEIETLHNKVTLEAELAGMKASAPFKKEIETLKNTIQEMQISHTKELKDTERQCERKLFDQKQQIDELIKRSQQVHLAKLSFSDLSQIDHSQDTINLSGRKSPSKRPIVEVSPFQTGNTSGSDSTHSLSSPNKTTSSFELLKAKEALAERKRQLQENLQSAQESLDLASRTLKETRSENRRYVRSPSPGLAGVAEERSGSPSKSPR